MTLPPTTLLCFSFGADSDTLEAGATAVVCAAAEELDAEELDAEVLDADARAEDFVVVLVGCGMAVDSVAFAFASASASSNMSEVSTSK